MYDRMIYHTNIHNIPYMSRSVKTCLYSQPPRRHDRCHAERFQELTSQGHLPVLKRLQESLECAELNKGTYVTNCCCYLLSYIKIYIYVYISIIIYSLKIYIFYFCNETTEMWKESLAEVPNIDSNRVLGAFDSFSSSDSRARSRAITVILTKSYETMKCKKDTYMY